MKSSALPFSDDMNRFDVFTLRLCFFILLFFICLFIFFILLPSLIPMFSLVSMSILSYLIIFRILLLQTELTISIPIIIFLFTLLHMLVLFFIVPFSLSLSLSLSFFPTLFYSLNALSWLFIRNAIVSSAFVQFRYMMFSLLSFSVPGTISALRLRRDRQLPSHVVFRANIQGFVTPKTRILSKIIFRNPFIGEIILRRVLIKDSDFLSGFFTDGFI